MQPVRLDRGRYYGQVYGDPVEKFYQDGKFFDGMGNCVRCADGSPVPQVKAQPEEAVTNVPDEDDGKVQRIKALRKNTFPALKKMAEQVSEATGDPLPEGGPGAKARFVAYIAERTD